MKEFLVGVILIAIAAAAVDVVQSLQRGYGAFIICRLTCTVLCTETRSRAHLSLVPRPPSENLDFSEGGLGTRLSPSMHASTARAVTINLRVEILHAVHGRLWNHR